MADVYYAVAGHPVNHSLSPVLVNIVAQYVSNQLKSSQRFNLIQTDLVDAKYIQDALAWGHVKFIPDTVNWDLTGAPFGKFRNKALMQKVLESTAETNQSIAGLSREKFNKISAKLPFSLKVNLPTKSFPEEVWINLTSPLKHQLKSDAVVDFNDSSLIESVNALRWDGFGWWSSNVDGSGVARVAQYFGVDIFNGAVLGIIGGGGAARSTAHTWQKLGGKVKIFGGKRDLSDNGWLEVTKNSDRICDFFVNFDDDTVPNDIEISGHVLNSKYQSVDGNYEDRVAVVTGDIIDGRWLLAAQHLESWSQLWAPQFTDMLPPLDLLVSMLVVAESVLASYS
ncbi:MAG TPA: hypothetical protein HA354_00270 [Candidatus Poseidoniaceae archaeon]|nr:hypothetical protein [Euryarchaeota archaeon]DAC60469.1 MAG TPA: hypothetical protein D7I07_00265 [Candidatus Poseidoniales archaeon]HII36913.1 hypothetical protein [Candidatus Poseidoniaceae archaeon]